MGKMLRECALGFLIVLVLIAIAIAIAALPKVH